MTHIAILSEGLTADLRPIGYGRSTWDAPFLGRPLLASTLEWLERVGCSHLFLLDDTPELWLESLAATTPVAIPMQHVDARRDRISAGATLAPLLTPLAPTRVYLIKPCALVAPDLEGLLAFHEQNASQATFALTRLDPGGLTWPFIPACRMDEHGAILEVDKLRRTDALGSATLENVLGGTAPSRPREFWAPRNLAVIEPELASRLPLTELLAPLSGLARQLASDGVACHGRALRGTWWPASSTLEVMEANRAALEAASHDETLLKIATPISPEAAIAADATVARSVVARQSEIESRAEITGSVLDSGVRVGAGSIVRESLLGADTALPAGASVVGSVSGAGEFQNLLRGVPMAGFYLDGIRSVDEDAVLTYWRESVPLFGRDPNATIVKTLARGLENNVYHLHDGDRHVVLKRRLDCNAHPLVREYHVMRALRQNGIAPDPYLLDLRPEIRVAPCIVMEFLEGEHLTEGAITPEIARAVARACLTVHTTPIDALLRDLPELADQAYTDLRGYVTDLVFQYGAWLEARQQANLGDDALSTHVGLLVGWLFDLAENENEQWKGYVPRALCQGDLREFNMVLHRGEVRLLDWERCGIDDPAYDVGWFLALANLSQASEQAFRDAYGPGLAGDVTFWRRVNAFRVADVLTWPIHLIDLARSVRDGQTPATDPQAQARQYERDAYAALARAFEALERQGGPALGGACDAERVRSMGPLFGDLAPGDAVAAPPQR